MSLLRPRIFVGVGRHELLQDTPVDIGNGTKDMHGVGILEFGRSSDGFATQHNGASGLFIRRDP